MALVGPSRSVARILELSGLDQVLSVHATAEEADAQ
jgi:anti-anti-sigma regulatory factor